MKTKSYPLTLIDEIHERLTLLREYCGTYADLPLMFPAETAEDETFAAIRSCIRQLMEASMTDRNGRVQPLVHKASHWQAIYRIMVDFNLGAADGDYIGFKALAAQIMPEGCRIPFSYEALRGISKTPFVRPFAKWHYDCTYFQTRKPYESMYRVANTFLGILRTKGLVKS